MASQTSKPVLPTHEHQLDRFREPCRTVSSIRIDGEGLKRLALSLRDFLIATWLDWLTIVIIGITAAGVRMITCLWLLVLRLIDSEGVGGTSHFHKTLPSHFT